MAAIDSALNAKGQMKKGGVYTFSMGREDLNVKVEGIDIAPDFGLAADIFFLGMGGGAMLMGEVPLHASEVNGVISRAIANNLQISAIHNHRIVMSPMVMWIHIMGTGAPGQLAAAMNRVLPPNGKFDRSGSQPKTSPLPFKQLGQILGGDAQPGSNGTVQVSVDRSQTIMMHGMKVPAEFGVNSQIYFQHQSGGNAAMEAELALVATEVNPVVRSLRASGIQITALHNHHINDQPHLYFLHTWAVGDAVTLAQKVRKALDLTQAKK
jgi:hypothetical protein